MKENSFTWVATKLAEMLKPGFYGEITVMVSNGGITHIRKTETLKPGIDDLKKIK